MSWVRLQTDWEIAKREGERRQALKERTTGSNRHYNNRENEVLANAVGYAAELAISRQYGLPMPEFREDLDRDEGYDFKVGDLTFDAKGCKTKPYFIPVMETCLQKAKAKAFALLWCEVDNPYCCLIGVISLSRILTYPLLDNCYEPRSRLTDNKIPGRSIPVEHLTAGDVFHTYLRGAIP